MFRQREQMRRRLEEIVQIFRQKGATSPEKAMTAQELELPSRFEEAMHRRLGQLGIFVEVNGKYYLSEDHLKQIREQRRQGDGRGSGGFGGSRRSMMSLRIARMATAALFVVLILVNLFVFSLELRIIAALAAVTWVVLTIAQFVYMARMRRRVIYLKTSQ
jgi:hypothetical protein